MLPEPRASSSWRAGSQSSRKHKRGILFLTFAGEELGLLGSSYYVNHPVLPLKDAVAMINMDMIGRIRDRKVYVGGVGTGTTFAELLKQLTPKHDFEADITERAGYGSSDHTSFTTKQVPVLFFFSGTARRLSQAQRYLGQNRCTRCSSFA